VSFRLCLLLLLAFGSITPVAESASPEPAFEPSIAGQAATDSIQAAVEAFVSCDYTHGVPYGPAHQLGPASVQYLATLLGQDSAKPSWRAIVQVLNFCGSPDSYPVLHDFIVHRFQGEIDEVTRRAIGAAVVTMGPLARISPEAMKFLSRGVHLEAWNQLRWTSDQFPGERRARSLAGACIVALCTTGTEHADRIFEELLSTGVEALGIDLTEAQLLELRDSNRQIMAEGFENNRRRRDEHNATHGGKLRPER
jgi:hypothetical protein